jgi:hypothetical protein
MINYLRHLLHFLCLIIYTPLAIAQKDPLPRSNPAAEGVSSADIVKFLDTLSKTNNEFHSLMILRHGKVIAEGWWSPYGPGLRHTMYSTSKSFTSTAVGFAVSEGKIKLSDKLISFFPAELPDTVSPKLASLTLKDVITMSDGQRPDPTAGAMTADSWARYFLSRPIVDTPGVNFLYNSLGTYMLSAVVQKVTGQTILDYLKPRLFDPLGITGMDWETSPQGIDAGGWGLRIKTEDMAKFGKLYLQKGNWNGKQILSSAWIDEATSYKINQIPNMAPDQRAINDWAQGYCYQFWRCRNNAYRADGAFGQYIIVMPDQDAVIAITSETISMQNELNLIWTFLLPAFKNEKVEADPVNDNLLKERLVKLSLIPDRQIVNSPVEKEISGKSFKLDSNERKFDKISFDFNNNKECTIHLVEDGQDYPITFGAGSWHLGETRVPGSPPSIIRAAKGPYAELGPSKYAASYSWKDVNSLELTIRYIESPHAQFFLCHFENGSLSIEFDGSVQRMAHRKNPTVKGVMVN